jgi:serine/threonine protein kinase
VAEDVFGIVGSLQAGAYRVIRVVAEGGFGVVYRAHHEGFRADVAIKCLKIPGSLSAEQKQGFLLRFREEGELLFHLSALIPAIVRPLHVGTIEQARHGDFVPFIALEWLEGESLEALVRRRAQEGKPALDLARAARLLGPAARAIERAHRFPGPQGVVSVLHRDLKPENLFIAELHGQDRLKILDFGIAKVKSAATQIVGRASNEGELSAFTPTYAAPEQWLPKRFGQTGTWTDVWGFALTLVEVLSGRPPFEGDLQAVMGACLDERQRPTPRALGVEVPRAVEAAFEKALAIDPRDRYSDIGSFWDVIESATQVHTPRILAERAAALQSVPPPQPTRSEIPDARLVHDAIPDLDLASIRPKGASGRPKLASGRPKRKASMEHDFQLLGNDAGPGSAFEPSIRPPSTGSRFEIAADSGIPERPLARVAVNVREGTRPRLGELGARSIPALKLLGLAALIMVGDIAYASQAGSPFTLGPLRAVYIAGPLGVWGLLKLANALLGE